MRKGLLVGLVILFVRVSALSQERWTRTEKTDALRGTTYTRFTLEGKFLEAPQQGQLHNPVLVIDCDPSKVRAHGHQHGKLLASFIAVRA